MARGGALAELLQQALQEAVAGNTTGAGTNGTGVGGEGGYAHVRASAYEAFMEAMMENHTNATALPPRQVPSRSR